ncbi:MAG: alpha-glucosidase [Lachnospiraceae bacterium]|nr:alpha-glucosidase [Lachnospiraceae bacterium]
MERLPWWKTAVIYEIYCKSFYDSNGDGIGDLPGILEKLPVLRDLGIDAVWFTPVYPSPQVDNGYDVSDYQDIDPAYGTLEDFRRVLGAAHALGIRVIMDQVLNHSSDEHFWFRESRKSKDNPYRNYYIWQPPKEGGKEPNNWGGYFREGNGSAWQYDEATGEYYLHQYSVKMPDLNWEYEPLRRELYRMLRWWLDMGVDGFRLDIFTRFKKPAGFPDTKKAPDLLLDRNGFIVDKSMCTNVPGIHELLHEMHEEVFSRYPSCMTVGEGAGVTAENAYDYIHPDRKEIDTVYHFELAGRSKPSMTAADYRRVQRKWEKRMEEGCWESQHFSNHDSARQVSSYGDDGTYRVPSAKTLAALNILAPGTVFLYQGEEIGMVNVSFDRIEDYNDRYTVGDYASMIRNGKSPKEALAYLAPRSRDNARTPYQWDGTKNAGFTKGTPWLKVNPRYPEINLAKDRQDPDGIFAFYRELIRLRRTRPALFCGNLAFCDGDHPCVIAFVRTHGDDRILVLANLSENEVPMAEVQPHLPADTVWKLLLSSLPDISEDPAGMKTIAPWECAVYESAESIGS